MKNPPEPEWALRDLNAGLPPCEIGNIAYSFSVTSADKRSLRPLPPDPHYGIYSQWRGAWFVTNGIWDSDSREACSFASVQSAKIVIRRIGDQRLEVRELLRTATNHP